METKRKSLIPFFTKGDIGGLTYMITNNIVNYIIIIATLQGFEWPDEIIFGRVIPGLSIGLLCGGLYGGFCGVAGPLISSLTTGMPAATASAPQTHR